VKEIGNVNVYAVVVAVRDCVTELSEHNLGVTLSQSSGWDEVEEIVSVDELHRDEYAVLSAKGRLIRNDVGV
jgi:hypothetical protein